MFTGALWRSATAQNGIHNVVPQAEVTLDSAKLLMGNLVRMNIRVTAASDSARIEFPLLDELRGRRYAGILNDTIEVRSPYSVDTLRDRNSTVFNFKFYIQAFDSGKYALPPFKIRVEGQPIETNSVTLEVLPVKVTAEDKIDPFSDPAQPFDIVPEGALSEEPNATNWIVWLIIGCVALLCLLAYLFFRYKKTGSILLRKPLAPYQVALKQLDKLEGQKLWQKGKTKTYYTRLTDIIRRYLNRQFGIKTLERTTTEIMADVERHPELEMFAPALKIIFSAADFVKFAKDNPGEEENVASLKEAREFVTESRPIEEEKTPEQKGGGK